VSLLLISSHCPPSIVIKWPLPNQESGCKHSMADSPLNPHFLWVILTRSGIDISKLPPYNNLARHLSALLSTTSSVNTSVPTDFHHPIAFSLTIFKQSTPQKCSLATPNNPQLDTGQAVHVSFLSRALSSQLSRPVRSQINRTFDFGSSLH
jgi:hypothetical protein